MNTKDNNVNHSDHAGSPLRVGDTVYYSRSSAEGYQGNHTVTRFTPKKVGIERESTGGSLPEKQLVNGGLLTKVPKSNTGTCEVPGGACGIPIKVRPKDIPVGIGFSVSSSELETRVGKFPKRAYVIGALWIVALILLVYTCVPLQ